MHLRSSVVGVCRVNFFMKFDVTYTGRRSLKGRGHLGLNWRPFDLQSKAVPLSYIPVQVAPWLLQNSKHPHFPILFHFFFALVASLQQAFTIFCRIGGSMVEFSPAMRETGVWFPANAFTIYRSQSLSRKLFHEIWRHLHEMPIAKRQGTSDLIRRPFDLQSKDLLMSYIPVHVAPWLLQNSKHPHFSIFFHFLFRVKGCSPTSLNYLLSHCGSVVEFSPAMRETGVRFPANAFTI